VKGRGLWALGLALLAAASNGEPQPRMLMICSGGVDGAYIEPIAWYSQGRYREVMVTGSDGKELGQNMRKFCDRYFNTGHRYTLWQGGSPSGQVTVVDCVTARELARGLEQDGSGAYSLEAQVKAPRLRREVALATNDGNLAARAPRSRPANAREAEQFRARFKTFGEMLVVDLDRQGGVEWVATSAHRLWITDASGKVRFQDSVQSSGQIQIMDHLDVDGDGKDELVYKLQAEGGWSYTVLSLKSGQWKKVFEGAGGGC